MKARKLIQIKTNMKENGIRVIDTDKEHTLQKMDPFMLVSGKMTKERVLENGLMPMVIITTENGKTETNMAMELSLHPMVENTLVSTRMGLEMERVR